jgi:hypothetical protein
MVSVWNYIVDELNASSPGFMLVAIGVEFMLFLVAVYIQGQA